MSKIVAFVTLAILLLASPYYGAPFLLTYPLVMENQLTWLTLAPEDKQDPSHYLIAVDLDKRKLQVYIDNVLEKEYTVAIGKPETPTPVGEFKIISKSKDWGGGFGTRWLGVNVPWGIYGIHGTDEPWTIGDNESAGCIRMHNKQVEELFEMIPLGTKVVFHGALPESSFNRNLKEGSTGKDVLILQHRLRELGFNPGNIDGYFGTQTTIAIKEAQLFYQQPLTGKADQEFFYLLGLKD